MALNHIASNTGRPFTDKDAAEYKADIFRQETGGQFIVVPFEGGYVIQAEPPAATQMVFDDIRPSSSAVEPGENSVDTGQARDFTEIPDMTGDFRPESKNAPAARHEEIVVTPSLAKDTQDEAIRADMLKAPLREKPKAEHEEKYSPVFKLRPALRNYYVQYLTAFFGMIIYARPTWLLYIFLTEQELFFSERKWIGETVPDAVSIIGLALIVLSLGRVLIDYLSHSWTVGEDYVIGKIGLLSRKQGSGNIQLADVQTFNPRQSVIEAMILGTGNVELGTAGTGGVDILFKKVIDPEGLILELKRRKKIATKKRFQPDKD